MNYTNLNQNINIYFKEIRSNSSMTRADEITLFTRISNGDKGAESEIFNKMAKLAVNIAKTYTSKADLLEDLIQEANMGVLEAIKKYDLTTGFRFSSYARFWMKCYIGKFLDEMGIVHPSSPVIIKMANKIRETFYKENNREISEYELMDELENQGQVVTDVNTILNITHIAIDKPVDDGESDAVNGDMGVFADRTASENAFLEKEEQEDLSSEIARRMRRLTPREQEFINMRFGFSTGYEMDYKTILETWNQKMEAKAKEEGWDDKKLKGEKLTTEERVRQIVTGALKKMK